STSSASVAFGNGSSSRLPATRRTRDKTSALARESQVALSFVASATFSFRISRAHRASFRSAPSFYAASLPVLSRQPAPPFPLIAFVSAMKKSLFPLLFGFALLPLFGAEPGLLFYLSGEQGTTADFSAGNTP